MKCELHCHSYFSDGSESPKKIMELANLAKIDVIALTDHDTIAGLAEAQESAMAYGIRLIPGVELSSYSTTEIHVLGYNFDINNQQFLDTLQSFSDQRQDRAEGILARLAHFNINLDKDSLPQGNSVGRLHIAKLLIEKGYVSSIPEAFDRYLGSSGIAYFPSKRITPFQAVEIIKKANGLPVLAHPLRYLQQGTLDSLINGLIDYGLKGLECYYPTHDAQTVQTLVAVAKKYNLIATGGSDFHGKNRNVALGEVDWQIDDFAKKTFNI